MSTACPPITWVPIKVQLCASFVVVLPSSASPKVKTFVESGIAAPPFTDTEYIALVKSLESKLYAKVQLGPPLEVQGPGPIPNPPLNLNWFCARTRLSPGFRVIGLKNHVLLATFPPVNETVPLLTLMLLIT